MRKVLYLATVIVVLIGLAAHAAAGGSKAVLKAPLVDRLTGDEVGWCMFQTTRDGAPQAKIRVVDGVPDTELAVELLVALEQGGGAVMACPLMTDKNGKGQVYLEGPPLPPDYRFDYVWAYVAVADQYSDARYGCPQYAPWETLRVPVK